MYCSLLIDIAEGEEVNIVHDYFEDILDTLGDNKETENDFESLWISKQH